MNTGNYFTLELTGSIITTQHLEDYINLINTIYLIYLIIIL